MAPLKSAVAEHYFIKINLPTFIDTAQKVGRFDELFVLKGIPVSIFTLRFSLQD